MKLATRIRTIIAITVGLTVSATFSVAATRGGLSGIAALTVAAIGGGYMLALVLDGRRPLAPQTPCGNWVQGGMPGPLGFTCRVGYTERGEATTAVRFADGEQIQVCPSCGVGARQVSVLNRPFAADLMEGSN